MLQSRGNRSLVRFQSRHIVFFSFFYLPFSFPPHTASLYLSREFTEINPINDVTFCNSRSKTNAKFIGVLRLEKEFLVYSNYRSCRLAAPLTRVVEKAFFQVAKRREDFSFD